jgi:glycosyltransferase involved in cell wall biosynthesis
MASWSGVGRYTVGLVRALAARGDLDVVQVVAEKGLVPADAATIVARHHPFTPSGAVELGALVRRSGCDLTHCLHFPVPAPKSAPCVVTLHDLSPLVVDGLMPSGVRRLAYRAMNQRAVKVADEILTVSEHSASDIVRVLGVPAERVTVAPNAADDFSSGAVGPVPAFVGDKRYILSMGNTKPHKDLPTLLRAFAAMDAADMLLVLVGKDPGDYASRVLGDDSAASRVLFTGPVSDEELRALYAGATVFAFPSRYEGFGLPPLEAMSFGTPVVVARAASLPEVVGEAGLYAEAGDVRGFAEAISRVVSDRALAEDLGRRGLAQAGKFSWSHSAEKTVAVYRRVLDGQLSN